MGSRVIKCSGPRDRLKGAVGKTEKCNKAKWKEGDNHNVLSIRVLELIAQLFELQRFPGIGA